MLSWYNECMTSNATETHLWETRHPYYNTLSYGDKHQVFSSWAEFAQPTQGLTGNEMFFEDKGNILYDYDDDYNFLYRWDWKRTDPSDYEYDLKEDPNFELPGDVLELFFMMQRKGAGCSAEVYVTEEDEPLVRAWLQEKSKYMVSVWNPFLKTVEE